MENKEEIAKELRELAPNLALLKKTSFYEAPEGYFANFSKNMLQTIRLNEISVELKQVAPELSKLEKVNVGEVPVQYFNELHKDVFLKIKQQAKVSGGNKQGYLSQVLDHIAGLVFKPKYTVAFAGFSTLVIMAVVLFVKVEQCTDLDCRFAQLGTEEINSYLKENTDNSALQIIETSDEKSAVNIEPGTIYKEALKDVDDAALNEAILEQ